MPQILPATVIFYRMLETLYLSLSELLIAREKTSLKTKYANTNDLK